MRRNASGLGFIIGNALRRIDVRLRSGIRAAANLFHLLCKLYRIAKYLRDAGDEIILDVESSGALIRHSGTSLAVVRKSCGQLTILN